MNTIKPYGKSAYAVEIVTGCPKKELSRKSRSSYEKNRDSSWETKIIRDQTLHKKWSFYLKISLVNVTKFAVSCGFGHISCRNP